MLETECRKLLRSAKRDPWAFFGEDREATYRHYALMLHPDTNGLSPEWFQELKSLKDKADEEPRIIESPQRAYTVLGQIGCGDLCDVFFATSDGEHYVLKLPRIAQRAANNLLAKEREVLEMLTEAAKETTYERYVPSVVESFADNEKRLNVFRWTDGLYSLDDIRQQHKTLDGRHVGWMFKRILTAVGFAHRQGWINGAVVPEHLLFSVDNHGLQLIGWTHATQFGKPFQIVPAKHKNRYPKDSRTANPSTDIFWAAQSMLDLADVNTPPLLRQFLSSCLLQARSLRPQDAWKLHDEFNDLLDHVYGPPLFVPLEM